MANKIQTGTGTDHTTTNETQADEDLGQNEQPEAMAAYAYNYCMCFTRKFRSHEISAPPDIRAAFASYSSGGTDVITGDGLRRFLSDIQGESADDVEQIVAKIKAKLRGKGGGGGDGGGRMGSGGGGGIGGSIGKLMRSAAVGSGAVLSVDEFFDFLFNGELNPPIRNKIHHDMSAPLSHYYIFTGHNSYLTGNQLNSESSTVPIIKALQRGVRVIELDMWPNSSKDNIHILHGGTLTSPVELEKCLKSIKEYAFQATEYPLVITLEDHLTPDLQAKVAQMLTDTFGDLLHVPSSADSSKEFPSPEDLKKKIIISTKPPKEYMESKDHKKGAKKRTDSAEEQILRKDITDSNAEESDDNDENDNEDDPPEEDSDVEDDPKFQLNTADQYRRLITVQAGKPKGPLRDALKVDPDKVRRLSLSEKQLAKATASHSADVIRFTQRNILRVYPKGTRIDSSNYDPFDAWAHGAQLVAFNMQAHDKALCKMQGFFKANGGCGYVKKPDFLIKTGPDSEVFSPAAKMEVKKTLKVKIYMGDGWRLDFSKTHFDTFSPPDFYARVGIVGVPADTVMKKTRTIEDEWVPVWDEEFTFALAVPELAVLRVEIQDYDVTDKNDFAGQTCLPVSELKQGIRAVPLYGLDGIKYTNVRLLMRFDFV